jgi:hypothetical protein
MQVPEMSGTKLLKISDLCLQEPPKCSKGGLRSDDHGDHSIGP